MSKPQVRPSPHVIFRELDGESVLLDLQTNQYFGLNEIGTLVWHGLVKNDLASVYEQVLASFEVDATDLERDVASLLAALAESGLIIKQEEAG